VLDLLQRAGDGLSVKQVASELGLHSNTARNHLDGLVAIGAATGESEPAGGRGRPARRYFASGPAEPDARVRDYAALATVLAGHLARTNPDAGEEVVAAGEAWGRSLTEGEQRRKVKDARRRTVRLLADIGFAPEPDDALRTVRLVRCPLLDAAREHPEVVCAVLLGLVRGALDNLGADPSGAELLPFAEPGACVLHM
jgi:predicted ArsR family transcriptional regulator